MHRLGSYAFEHRQRNFHGQSARYGASLAILALAFSLQTSETALAQAGTLEIADDGSRIMHAGGTEPFFWLGDTAWELLHRTTREEAVLYLEDRARKGFNVIQSVVLAELDGLHTPNSYGETPLLDDDPARPNDAYFKHVDFVVDKAAELGLYVGLLPTWGDKFNKRWGIGPEVFTPENARTYGEFLGARYTNAPIIWILGGDRAPEETEDIAIIRAMAEGLRRGHEGRHLMTYHPMGERKSWEWFADDDWLDIHLFQSSHGARDVPNYEFVAEGRALRSVKPVIDGEPRYEDHPVSWDPEQGWFDASDVRQAAYWSVLAGAAGHTYGNHNVWQFWEPGREPISSARTPWKTALAHSGAAQMGFMKQLFLSRDFPDLIPDQQLVGPEFEGPAHIRAARHRDGSFMIAYSPYGQPIRVDLSSLSADRFRGWWFDPRTGVPTHIGIIDGLSQIELDPPGENRRGNDWILVLDDLRAAYPPPGS